MVASAVVLAALGLRGAKMNRDENHVVEDYGAEILRAAPPHALLLTKGDLITNVTRYLQLSNGTRADVEIVDQELLGYEWYGREIHARYPDVRLPGPRYSPGAADGYAMKQLLDSNADRGAPILICGGVREGDASANGTYGFWPFGFCELAHLGSEPMNVDAWLRESEDALPRIAFGDEARPPGSWEEITWTDYWAVRANRGAQLITIAGADPGRRRYLAEAATTFERLIATCPTPPPLVYKDLAIAIGRQGLATPADRARAANAWRHYLDVAPPEDPQRPGIEKELARLNGG
jgi:hypothetical protein